MYIIYMCLLLCCLFVRVVGKDVRVQADTNKLVDLGFKYKYAVDETLSCSVECAKRLGLL